MPPQASGCTSWPCSATSPEAAAPARYINLSLGRLWSHLLGFRQISCAVSVALQRNSTWGCCTGQMSFVWQFVHDGDFHGILTAWRSPSVFCGPAAQLHPSPPHRPGSSQLCQLLAAVKCRSLGFCEALWSGGGLVQWGYSALQQASGCICGWQQPACMWSAGGAASLSDSLQTQW